MLSKLYKHTGLAGMIVVDVFCAACLASIIVSWDLTARANDAACKPLPTAAAGWDEKLTYDTTMAAGLLSVAFQAPPAGTFSVYQATSPDHIVARLYALDDRGCVLASAPIAYDVWNIALSLLHPKSPPSRLDPQLPPLVLG